jgi:hypothetical protein
VTAAVVLTVDAGDGRRDLLAWMQILALTEYPARRWKPQRLRLRLLAIAGRLTLPAADAGCTSPLARRSPRCCWPDGAG